MPGAAALTFALVIPAGGIAGGLAIPWAGACAVVAALGALRFLERSRRWDPVELCVDAGLAYLAVGGAWAWAYRSDHVVLGFAGTQALLTANHFHYAGFGATVLVGGLGRLRRAARGGRRDPIWAFAAAGTCRAALVAAGITFSRAVEVAAAWWLAANVVVVAGLLGVEARRSTSRLARSLLAVAALSGLAPAALAVHFSMTGFARLDAAAFERMVLFRGLVNAVGFVGAGLAGIGAATAARAQSPRPRGFTSGSSSP